MPSRPPWKNGRTRIITPNVTSEIADASTGLVDCTSRFGS